MYYISVSAAWKKLHCCEKGGGYLLINLNSKKCKFRLPEPDIIYMGEEWRRLFVLVSEPEKPDLARAQNPHLLNNNSLLVLSYKHRVVFLLISSISDGFTASRRPQRKESDKSKDRRIFANPYFKSESMRAYN